MTPEEAIGKAAREAMQLIEQVRLQGDVELPFSHKRVLSSLEAISLEMSHSAGHSLAELAAANADPPTEVSPEARECGTKALLGAAAALLALWAMSQSAAAQEPDVLN